MKLKAILFLSLAIFLFVQSNLYSATILSESFDGAFPPAGWNIVSTDTGNYTWTQVSEANPLFPVYSGTGSAGVFPDSLIQDEKLITPKLDLSSVGTEELTFWWYLEYIFADSITESYLHIKVSTDDGVTFTDTVATFSPLDDTLLGWNQYKIDLSKYDGNNSVRIMFHYVHLQKGSPYWYDGMVFGLDDVRVRTVPNKDASVISIDEPTISILPGQNLRVKATVGNVGKDTLPPFNVRLKILDGATTVFADTQSTLENLPPSSTYQIIFDGWTVPQSKKTYTIEVMTALQSDEDNSNDILSTNVVSLEMTVLSVGMESEGAYPPSNEKWFGINLSEGTYYITKAEVFQTSPSFYLFDSNFALIDSSIWWEDIYLYKINISTAGNYYIKLVRHPVNVYIYNAYSFAVHSINSMLQVATNGGFVRDSLDADTTGGANDLLDAIVCTAVSADSYEVAFETYHQPFYREIYNLDGVRIDTLSKKKTSLEWKLDYFWEHKPAYSGEKVIILITGGQTIYEPAKGPYTIYASAPGGHDVGVKSISAPGKFVETNATITPSVIVKNYGIYNENSIPIEFSILSVPDYQYVYRDTAFTNTVVAGDTAKITFKQWTAGSTAGKKYLMFARTLLASDNKQENNIAQGNIILFSAIEYNNFNQTLVSQFTTTDTIWFKVKLTSGEKYIITAVQPFLRAYPLLSIYNKNFEVIKSNNSTPRLPLLVYEATDANEIYLQLRHYEYTNEDIYNFGIYTIGNLASFASIDATVEDSLNSDVNYGATNIYDIYRCNVSVIDSFEIQLIRYINIAWYVFDASGNELTPPDFGKKAELMGTSSYHWIYYPTSVPQDLIVLLVSYPGSWGAKGTYTLKTVSLVPVSVANKGSESLPNRFDLFQNYPNPFNPETIISYQLPVIGNQSSYQSPITDYRLPITNYNVNLSIYSITGQLIRTLVNEEQKPGYYTVKWDGRDDRGKEVSSGLYIYTIKAGEFSNTKRMIIVK